jgi:hypothetical protein
MGLLYLYLLYITAIWLTPGGSSTTHIYIQRVHKIQGKEYGKCGPCLVFASYTLAFALQLRKKHGKTSVRVAKYKNNEQYNTHKNNSTTV